MNYENLHTSTLERLFGPIKLRIISVDDGFRITELYDSKGTSRTLGIVRFLNINGQSLKAAHNKILKGELLGKTLFDSNIEFGKEYIGSCRVKLPDWLKKDFKTKAENGIGIYSKILVHVSSESEGKLLYAEIIEIIPPELKHEFTDKVKPLNKISKNLLSLLKAANLEVVKFENEL
jgi:hypothetical protein